MNCQKIGEYTIFFCIVPTFIKLKNLKWIIGDGKMKTNEEKMNEELTELFMNYEKERKRIENEIKDKGLWETFGLDANEHFFKSLKKEVQKKEAAIRLKYGKL